MAEAVTTLLMHIQRQTQEPIDKTLNLIELPFLIITPSTNASSSDSIVDELVAVVELLVSLMRFDLCCGEKE